MASAALDWFLFCPMQMSTLKTVFILFTAIEAMIMRKYNISAEDFKVMETVILKSEPHKAGQQVCAFSFIDFNKIE